jgi:hypothetical protein
LTLDGSNVDVSILPGQPLPKGRWPGSARPKAQPHASCSCRRKGITVQFRTGSIKNIGIRKDSGVESLFTEVMNRSEKRIIASLAATKLSRTSTKNLKEGKMTQIRQVYFMKLHL